MRRSPLLLLTALVACLPDEAPAGGGRIVGVTEVPPISGRWVGTSGAGDTVDLSLIEIQNHLGGHGVVIRGGETAAVGVEGRHEARAVTFTAGAPGRTWTFDGTLGDRRAIEMIGRWTTTGGSTGLTLFRCDVGATCP